MGQEQRVFLNQQLVGTNVNEVTSGLRSSSWSRAMGHSPCAWGWLLALKSLAKPCVSLGYVPSFATVWA